MATTFSRGQMYESLVIAYYIRLGYTFVDRNVRVSHKEIDIIMQFDSCYVFIEVKSGNLSKNPFDFLTESKISNLHDAITVLLTDSLIDNYRIDYVYIGHKKNMFNITVCRWL